MRSDKMKNNDRLESGDCDGESTPRGFRVREHLFRFSFFYDQSELRG